MALTLTKGRCFESFGFGGITEVNFDSYSSVSISPFAGYANNRYLWNSPDFGVLYLYQAPKIYYLNL